VRRREEHRHRGWKTRDDEMRLQLTHACVHDHHDHLSVRSVMQIDVATMMPGPLHPLHHRHRALNLVGHVLHDRYYCSRLFHDHDRARVHHCLYHLWQIEMQMLMNHS